MQITFPILEQYRNLIELGKTLAAKLEKTDVIEHIMVQAKHLLCADRCSLFLVVFFPIFLFLSCCYLFIQQKDRENQLLVSQFADGEGQIQFSITEGIAGTDYIQPKEYLYLLFRICGIYGRNSQHH